MHRIILLAYTCISPTAVGEICPFAVQLPSANRVVCSKLAGLMLQFLAGLMLWFSIWPDVAIQWSADVVVQRRA
jgi:hypothetical protein